MIYFFQIKFPLQSQNWYTKLGYVLEYSLLLNMVLFSKYIFPTVSELLHEAQTFSKL